MDNAWKILIKSNNGLISVSIREMKKLCRTSDSLAGLFYVYIHIVHRYIYTV